MREGFFYDFSNYGSYEQLTTDGITQWHPAFFELGSFQLSVPLAVCAA